MSKDAKKNQDIKDVLEINRSYLSRKNLKLYLAIGFVFIILFSFIFFLKTKNSNAIQYKTEKVKRGDLTVIVTATGTLQPKKTVTVGSELSGIIKSVEVNYNDRVKVGQILAKLDTSKLEAQLTQVKAELEVAKAKVMQAKATLLEAESKLNQLKKARELSNGKVPSQIEMDSAIASYEKAKAEEASSKAGVIQAEATLKSIETDLAKSIIRSPINGIVLKRNIEPGQTVAASFQTPELFTLAEDLSQMELHLNIDEADVGKVKVGQKAVFTVSAYPNRTFNAVVTEVRYASTTVSGVVTYEAVLNVNNPDLSLRPGMTATADITVKKIENALIVPSSALRFTPKFDVNIDKPSVGGLVTKILPRPPAPEHKLPEESKRKQQIWILKEGNIIPVPVLAGEASAGMTEIIKGDIKEGAEVVIDIVTGIK